MSDRATEPDWRAVAACRGMHAWWPHPDAPGTWMKPDETVERALAVCADCPVVDPCADFARTVRESGVYGGRILRRGHARGEPRQPRQPRLAIHPARDAPARDAPVHTPTRRRASGESEHTSRWRPGERCVENSTGRAGTVTRLLRGHYVSVEFDEMPGRRWTRSVTRLTRVYDDTTPPDDHDGRDDDPDANPDRPNPSSLVASAMPVDPA